MSVVTRAATAERSVTSPTRPYRLFGGYRLLLALMVAVQHFSDGLVSVPARQLLAPLAPGNVAVMIFFVMSGFIIFEARAVFYRDRPLAFLLNRSLRIVPPFIAAVGLSILVHFALSSAQARGGADYSARNVMANLLGFVPGYSAITGEGFHEFFEFAWSIRVEFLFYLLVFAAMCGETLMRRFLRGVGAQLPMRLLCAATLFLFLAWRIGLPVPVQAYVQYGPYFIFGAALYSAHAGSRGALLLCLLTAPMLLWQFRDYEDLWFRYGKNTAAQLTLLAILLAILAILPSLRPDRRATKIDSRLGELSYPFYLNHPLAGAVVGELIAARTAWVGALALSAALALALLMYRAVEPAFERLRTAVRGATVGG